MYQTIVTKLNFEFTKNKQTVFYFVHEMFRNAFKFQYVASNQ